MNKITILYANDTEETFECYDVGETRNFTMFFGEDDRPFRMIRTEEIVEIFIEYPDDNGMDIHFEPDEREVH